MTTQCPGGSRFRKTCGLGAVLLSLVLGVLGVIALLLVLGPVVAAGDWRSVGPAATGDGRTITGHVFYDLDASGDRDAGETGAPGVTVRTSTGLTATTDAGGGYELDTSSEPAISVTIEIPPGYVATTPISVPVPAVSGTYTVDFGIRVAVYMPFVATSYRPSPIINGGFEEGWTGWRHGGELSQTIALTNPHSGSRAALLGSPDYPCRNVPIGRAWVSQTIRVPSTASPNLSFWYNIRTYDINPGLSNSYDLFRVTINGVQAFKYMTTTGRYGCQDPVKNLGWREGTVTLGVHRGSYVTICFENWNQPDPYYNTWTYVDDVRIADP